MAATIYGLNDVSIVQQTDSFDRRGGYVLDIVYKGPVDKAIAKFIALFTTYGKDSLRLSIDKGVGTVYESAAKDVSPGTAEDSETWEIAGGQLDKPLESFPGRPVSEPDGGAGAFNLDADLATMTVAIQQLKVLGNMAYTPAADPALIYSKMVKRGVEAYLRSTLTATRTKVCSSRTLSMYLSFRGVDRAWKENDTNGPWSLPGGLATALAGMDDYDSGKKQWLKLAPTSTTTDAKMYTVRQEWLWAKRWSHTLYGGDDEADGSNP